MSGSDTCPDGAIELVLDRFWALTKRLGHLQVEEWLGIDLTMPQVKVLFVLSDRGRASVGGLASALRVSLPTMTGILDRLVEHGLVRRQEYPEDRRLVLNGLTEMGAELIDRLRQARREQLTRILRRMSPEDLDALAESLNKLRQAADEEYRLWAEHRRGP